MALPIHVSRNGVLVPPTQACVPVFTPALYGAYGIYESMQVANGVVFALDAHLQRLEHSAALLEMPLPADNSTAKRWIAEVIAANGSQVWGTTCGGCFVDIYQGIGNPANGGGGIYKGSVAAALDGAWYVDLSTLPGMAGATVKDVSFATYGPVSGSSEMSPRPMLYLPVVRK